MPPFWPFCKCLNHNNEPVNLNNAQIWTHMHVHESKISNGNFTYSIDRYIRICLQWVLETYLPVMTCNEAGLCLDNICCISKSSVSRQLNDSSDEEHTIPLFISTLFWDTEWFGCTWVSICWRRSCKARIASDAWRPCRSNFHIFFLLFLMLKISLAALALSLSAANHSSWAFIEWCWAERWSPLKKAFVLALECWDADLFVWNN